MCTTKMKIKSAAFKTALDNELADRKRRVAKLRKERLAEVYSAVPEIEALDKELLDLAVDIGRGIIDSGGAASSDLARKALDDKYALRKKLLIEHGFTPDYTEPKAICDFCNDTGRVRGELCRCVTQLAVKTAFEGSGIDHEQCFENFDLTLQTSKKNVNAMAKILDYALEYANNFPNNKKHDLLYYGPPGVGKTYLVNCIGGRVLERGYSVLKINSNRLIQLTLDTLRSSPDEKPDFILPDLLIIDDLGAEPMIPNITVETLLSILCERQDSKKSTIFATNLDVVSGPDSTDSIQDFYGERFASRLMAPRTVKIQQIGTDNVRLINKD